MTTIATTLLTIVELPYAYDALEPYISAETLHFHHDKHYAGYVRKLAELTEGTHFQTMSLEEVIRSSDGAIFNNAAQVWNHEFYFEELSASPKVSPAGELRRAIEAEFGSVDDLKRRMTTAATTLFGSGWVWLATDGDGKLYIISKPNAETPLTDGLTPLLCIDVWEHAYYIDFRNMRKDSVEAFWKVLDWGVVERRYSSIL
ncbi:MAG: superoxide dismutase [Alistipes sp.]|jgi:Fe-Mn family superoxide dismutase|nr:superoxide dismutase [Alistipes sp.]